IDLLSRLRSLLGRENGEHPETRERQKEAAVQAQRKTRTYKRFWRRHKAAMEPSSHPTLLTKKEVRTKLERLTMELQLVTSQRNELRDRLIFVTEGTMDNRYPLFQTPGHKLKLEHKEIMSELKTCVSSGLHSRLLMEQTQLKKKVDMLRQENKKLMEDWVLLKHHLKDLKVICKDQEKETSDLQTQQQQVGAGRWLEQATAQGESPMQREALQQEPPAEPRSQQPLKSGDEVSSSDLVSIVE
uniref:Disks large homolog 5 N-terminal domain-containing protein n=1 Tax=Peromyscus maniculatus bairdii TaxID=230844 RepID=A0A8C8UI32_PERMB